MNEVDSIPQEYGKAVDVLAREHAAAFESDVRIFAFDDPQENVVRLIEVTPDTPETGEAVVISFGRSSDFPYASGVAVVTPGEWDQILAGQIPLPTEWDLTKRRQVWPND